MAKKVAKKQSADKNQSASPVINKINSLLNDKKNLSWATMIPADEVTFLYDISAQSQARKDLSLTERQSKWALKILEKIAGLKLDK